jgi:hypothetical protein
MPKIKKRISAGRANKMSKAVLEKENLADLRANVFDTAQTSGEAIIVSYNDTWIQALKVQNDNRVAIHRGFRLQNKGQRFRSSHRASLPRRWRHWYVIQGLCQPQHHRLHAKL